MEKRGFRRIGYVNNLREYPFKIRELAGISYFDFGEFDDFIDAQWDARAEKVLCFDANREQLSPESGEIVFFLIATPFEADGETIYARFIRRDPAPLVCPGWSGVEIGTYAQLVNRASGASSSDNELESVTSISGYVPIARAIYEASGREVTAAEARELLNASYTAAQESGNFGVIANERDAERQFALFPLEGYASIEGGRVFVKMEKNKAPLGKKWYGAFILSEEALKDELLSFSTFHVGYFSFGGLGEANWFFNSLAAHAMNENWKWSGANSVYDQPILKSYLEFTYYRLLDEDAKIEDEEKKKIVHYAGKVYFNSGLLDRNFRQIIIVAQEQTVEKEYPVVGLCRWELLSNLSAHSHSEQEIARVFHPSELPALAKYFEDCSQVVFDARYSIQMNDNHIFEDGVARGRLPKYQAEYERVKGNEMEKDLLLARIARDFDSACERARLMAERNYKLAVPQFWKETGEIQFLLPIYLGEREEAESPQCALVLSLDKSGRRPYYRGETILTLDMAYNNTRLIAKPDVFWLNELV